MYLQYTYWRNTYTQYKNACSVCTYVRVSIDMPALKVIDVSTYSPNFDVPRTVEVRWFKSLVSA